MPEGIGAARHRACADAAARFRNTARPAASEFKQVSWDFALDRIATLMKQDRDANFIAKNAAGTTVNRWLTTGMLAASASSSETAYLTWKVARSFGMLVFDNQARV